MYIAQIPEGNQILFTPPFATVDEAIREGKRRFFTDKFYVVEIKTWADCGVPNVWETLLM